VIRTTGELEAAIAAGYLEPVPGQPDIRTVPRYTGHSLADAAVEAWSHINLAGVTHVSYYASDEYKQALRSITAWVQSLTRWTPPGPADHLREAVTALADISGATRVATWWRARQARRAAVHVVSVNRALVSGHLGAGTSGLPIEEDA
jgi:hypothetical protein